jgi:hypothetical protein
MPNDLDHSFRHLLAGIDRALAPSNSAPFPPPS